MGALVCCIVAPFLYPLRCTCRSAVYPASSSLSCALASCCVPYSACQPVSSFSLVLSLVCFCCLDCARLAARYHLCLLCVLREGCCAPCAPSFCVACPGACAWPVCKLCDLCLIAYCFSCLLRGRGLRPQGVVRRFPLPLVLGLSCVCYRPFGVFLSQGLV